MTLLLEAKQYHQESEPVSHRYTLAFDEDNPSLYSIDKLGGKGFYLKEMTLLGLPVPPGFTLTTDIGMEYLQTHVISELVWREIYDQMNELECKSGKRLGDPDNPLFISVRSGAKYSLPGAMETILNVGITPETLPELEYEIGTVPALQSYAQLLIDLSVFGLGVNPDIFTGVTSYHTETDPHKLRILIDKTRTIISKQEYGLEVFDNAYSQQALAIHAVLRSSDSQKARDAKSFRGITQDIGTAVNIQQMIFGNAVAEGAGAGVAHTRDFLTLGRRPSIAFTHGQGTDVVGTDNKLGAQSIDDLPIRSRSKRELRTYLRIIRDHYGLEQDVEFTIDKTGKVWILQTRKIKLEALAQLRWCHRKIQTLTRTHQWSAQGEKEIQKHISFDQLSQLLVPPLDPEAVKHAKRIAEGIGLGYVNEYGIVVTSIDQAQRLYAEYPQEHIILATRVTDPSAIMKNLPDNVMGIVAVNGGTGSHIAQEIRIINNRNIPIIFNADIRKWQGQVVTIDALSGHIYEGIIPRKQNGLHSQLNKQERQLLHRWHRDHMRNPWEFIAHDTEIIDTYERQIHDAYTVYQPVSQKAREYIALNAVMPPELKFQYTVVPVNDKTPGTIRNLAYQVFESEGYHITIRTCHKPDKPAGGPWIELANMEELEAFLRNESYPGKYGGFERWKQDPDLTEILVGVIPANKLNPNPHIREHLGVFTLTITPSGRVVAQVAPHTPQLRDFEEKAGSEKRRMISITTEAIPHERNVRKTTFHTDEELIGDEYAFLMSHQMHAILFDQWWEKDHIPEIMAALTRVFGNHTTPVLEGQLCLDDIGKLKWLRIYGIKPK